MPTVVQVFRPHTDFSDLTGPITDVRALYGEAGDIISNDNTTKADFGASGAKTIWLDPFTSSTDVTVNRSDVGWAINLDGAEGMEAVDGDFQRRILSGTWQLIGRATANALAIADVFCKFRIYKRNADASRTLVQESSEQNLGKVPVAGTNIDVSAVGVPEILLLDGETILIEVAFRGTGQVGGLNISFRVNFGPVGSDTVLTLPAPGVRSKFSRTLSQRMDGVSSIKKKIRLSTNTFPAARMDGISSITPKLTLKRTFSARMDGIAIMTRVVRNRREFSTRLAGIATIVWRFRTVFPARLAGIATIRWKKRFDTANFGSTIMKGIAILDRRLILHRTFSATMKGIATIIWKFKTVFSARLVGIATMTRRLLLKRAMSARLAGIATVKKLIRLRTNTFPVARMVGIATMTKFLRLFRSFSARMAGVPNFVRVVRNRRALQATMKGRASARIEMPFERVPSGEGGGGPIITIIRKIFPIED